MEEKFTLAEADEPFGKQLHSLTWTLLEKTSRTPDEDELMLHAAHASLYHWLQVGTAVHHQRGIWMIARVHTVLGNRDQALRYANRCMELTNAHGDLLEDFDIAFAWEAIARTQALAGHQAEAQKALARAIELGEAIVDEEDREIYFQELDGGDWYGVR